MTASPRFATALILFAHPDDGEFMCGGTVGRWAREGTQVHYVIVTDGFTGNVMLKLSEGLTEAMLSMLKRELMATAVTKAGAMLAKPAFRSIKRRLDYTEYGGAPLLGVNRIVVIGHGRSNAKAIRNAIRSVKEFSENRTSERIEKGITETRDLGTLAVSGA